MATFLDLTLLGGFRVVFLWLLVYVVVWGLLSWIKPFGEKSSTGPYALIALVAAFLTVLSPTLRLLIEFVTPWFIFLIMLIFFIIFILRIWGLGEGDMTEIIKQPSVYNLLVVILIVISLFALGEAFGQRSLAATNPQAQPSPQMPVIGPDGQANGYGMNGQQNNYQQPGAQQPSLPQQAPQPGQPGATDTGDFSVNFINTLFHPKILAILAMLLIAVAAIWMLSRPEYM